MIKPVLRRILEVAFPSFLPRREARRLEALVRELAKLPVRDSGIEEINGERVPYLLLDQGPVLFGKFPIPFERHLYRQLKRSLSAQLVEDAFRVAMDAVLRYVYPHGMPHLTPPYSIEERRGFHLQHLDTIQDFSHLDDQARKLLVTAFRPMQGESFLDIGSYLGFGLIRMSEELGEGARLIAVEADPENFRLLSLNVARNNLRNVALYNRAIWETSDHEILLGRADRTSSTVVAGILNSTSQIPVTTITVDEIVATENLPGIDRISVTVNGAEVETIKGAAQTLRNSRNPRISLAGWFKRDGVRICDIVAPLLRSSRLNVAVGSRGSVFAWK
jgi:FkbM family methyltransferase